MGLKTEPFRLGHSNRNTASRYYLLAETGQREGYESDKPNTPDAAFVRRSSGAGSWLVSETKY